MARAVTSQRKAINTVVAWAIGLLIFFPILWTILTSFKTEAQAIASPPRQAQPITYSRQKREPRLRAEALAFVISRTPDGHLWRLKRREPISTLCN